MHLLQEANKSTQVEPHLVCMPPPSTANVRKRPASCNESVRKRPANEAVSAIVSSAASVIPKHVGNVPALVRNRVLDCTENTGADVLPLLPFVKDVAVVISTASSRPDSVDDKVESKLNKILLEPGSVSGVVSKRAICLSFNKNSSKQYTEYVSVLANVALHCDRAWRFSLGAAIVRYVKVFQHLLSLRSFRCFHVFPTVAINTTCMLIVALLFYCQTCFSPCE